MTGRKRRKVRTQTKKTFILSPLFFHGLLAATLARAICFSSFHTQKRSRPLRLVGRSYTAASDAASFLQPPHSDDFRPLSTLHHQLLPALFYSESVLFFFFIKDGSPIIRRNHTRPFTLLSSLPTSIIHIRVGS